MATHADPDFPCSLQIDVPFPTARLASIAIKAITVDKELSPLVRRDFSTVDTAFASGAAGGVDDDDDVTGQNVMRVFYKATTNRMLRVSVNSFMDSLSLILEVMERLDADVLESRPIEPQAGPFR
ncbi:putative transcription factor pcc1 [Diaporthe ampelina]|uniref:Putative transcription factor pcc1 n=1 Tax=Diaporthe ampelina TaxID=1214573 RepID=A0A0G2HUF6_9PEZI|nr:putative transcription factor pcc1 [Diaporthe ampelina]